MAHWLTKTVELLCAETSDLRELAAMVGRSPETFYVGVDPQCLEQEGKDLHGIAFSSATITGRIDDIRKRERVGERMAMLLDLIFEFPSLQLEVAQQYGDDRSRRVRDVLATLKRPGFYSSDEALYRLTPKGRELNRVRLIQVARLAQGPIVTSSRANLFYYMAMHLSKYEDVKRYLRQSLNRISSRSYERYLPEIRQLLA